MLHLKKIKKDLLQLTDMYNIKCKGGKCTLKKECHRYKSKRGRIVQSYFVSPPFEKGDDGKIICTKYLKYVK